MVPLVDKEGERLHGTRMDRMPKSRKATLTTMVIAEVEADILDVNVAVQQALGDRLQKFWVSFLLQMCILSDPMLNGLPSL